MNKLGYLEGRGQWRSHGGGDWGGRVPPTCPKDRLWDSSRSDEKLVRLGVPPEYLRCAPKYTISRLNNPNFSEEGAQPPPQTPHPAEETPSPHPTPLGTFGASLLGLAPSAIVPPLKNAAYAPGRGN